MQMTKHLALVASVLLQLAYSLPAPTLFESDESLDFLYNHHTAPDSVTTDSAYFRDASDAWHHETINSDESDFDPFLGIVNLFDDDEEPVTAANVETPTSVGSRTVKQEPVEEKVEPAGTNYQSSHGIYQYGEGTNEGHRNDPVQPLLSLQLSPHAPLGLPGYKPRVLGPPYFNIIKKEEPKVLMLKNEAVVEGDKKHGLYPSQTETRTSKKRKTKHVKIEDDYYY